MNENAEIMDKLRDNGLSEEVNKRIADVYSRVHLGALKNSLTYSEVIDLFEGLNMIWRFPSVFMTNWRSWA